MNWSRTEWKWTNQFPIRRREGQLYDEKYVECKCLMLDTDMIRNIDRSTHHASAVAYIVWSHRSIFHVGFAFQPFSLRWKRWTILGPTLNGAIAYKYDKWSFRNPSYSSLRPCSIQCSDEGWNGWNGQLMMVFHVMTSSETPGSSTIWSHYHFTSSEAHESRAIAGCSTCIVLPENTRNPFRNMFAFE